jgi:hypothetical protein
MAVVSILATLTSGAVLESMESRGMVPLPDRAVIAAADPAATAASPDSLTFSDTVSSTTAAPATSETSLSTSSTSTTTMPTTTSSTTPTSTSTTIPDPTFEDIERMRIPGEVVVEFEGVVSFSLGTGAQFDVPPTRESCIRDAKTSPLKVDGVYDRNLIAQMTHEVFECLTSVAGLDEVAPTALRRWNGASRWGFASLSEQVASEAIVVAYCESAGFNPRALTGANGFGYAGLFQMGSVEMRRFGEPGSSRFDPVDNAIGAANYFLFQYRNGAGWGGWSPWAVVNTNFNDEVNDQVKVPVLPRFVSTDPDFRGRPGPELPAWAVDPWEWNVPHWNGTGCPYNGGRWPAASIRTQG